MPIKKVFVFIIYEFFLITIFMGFSVMYEELRNNIRTCINLTTQVGLGDEKPYLDYPSV